MMNRGYLRKCSWHSTARALLGGTLVFALSACEAERRLVTIEDILEIRQTGEPLWSPDGEEIAFVWGRGVEQNLWAADSSAGEPGQPGSDTLKQLSPLAGRSGAVLSHDWKHIAYVSKDQIWKIPLGGGRPVRLTREEGKYSSLVWSPDSRHIAFIIEQEEQEQTDVGIVSAAGSEATMIAMTPQDEDSPTWAPSSDRIAFIRRLDNWQGYEICVSDLEGTDEKHLVTETYERGVEEFRFDGNHHWSPDGTRIVYLSSRSGYNHLWIADVAGGDPVEITHATYVDYSPRWAPKGDRIVFISSRGDDLEERHVWVVDASGGEPVRLSPDGFCADPAWSPDGSRIAYLRSSAAEPPEVAVQEAEPYAPVLRLTESRPDPAVTESFVEPESVRYKSRDGTAIPAVLLRPRSGAPVASRPGLLFFHGKGGINLKGWGGLSSYAFHQYLVQRGYAVLFVNWRGTHIGYGTEFEQANYRDYGGGELEDVVAGAEFLREEVGVDAKRIACWGGSYGGYMTMLAITKAPDVFSAGISRAGVSDWASFLEQCKRKLWRVRLRAKLGDPEENPELYEQSAPLRYADQAQSPLLINQGQDDDGVVPEQGESLYEAMREAGKTVEYVAYIGEGHGFRHTGSLRDLYHRVDAFLEKYLERKASSTP